MFKLTKLNVNNFKNIINTDVELHDFNVIVGPNNSGKSNLLSVISFLKLITQGSQTQVQFFFNTGYSLDYSENYLPNDSSVGNTNIQLSFLSTDSNNEYNYSIDLRFERVNAKTQISVAEEKLEYKNRNTTGRFIRIFEKSNTSLNLGAKFTGKLIDEVANNSSVITLLNILPSTLIPDEYKEGLSALNAIINSPIFYFSSFELRKGEKESPREFHQGRRIYVDLNKDIIELKEKKDKFNLFKEIANKLLNISEFSFFNFTENPSDKENKNTRTLILFNHLNSLKSTINLSDGSLLLLTLIAEILNSDKDVFLIEEPENSIHPKALSELITFLKGFSNEKQFIITSHSAQILNQTDPSEVLIGHLNEKGFSKFEGVKDVKELRRKINKGYVSFGDLLIQNIDEEDEHPIETL